MCVEAMTDRGGGGASPGATQLGSSHSTQLQAQIVAHSPIGVMSRAELARAVADSLPPFTSAEQSGTVALLYTVKAGAPGDFRTRVRTYIRWTVSPGLSSIGVRSISAVEPGKIRPRLGRLDQHTLQAHYAQKLANDLDLTAFQREISAGRAAELAYTRLLHASEGLAPVQVQPLLDLLVSRSSCAALQFVIERLPGDALPGGTAGARRLRLGIVVVGTATAPGALRVLARELRGHGVLTAHGTSLAMQESTTQTPNMRPLKLKVFRPQSACERAHICQNFSAPAAEPWPQSTQSVEMAITSADTGFLFPLPFLLLT